MMPDYMESHVSYLGLPRVLQDLRKVVLDMAENCYDTEYAKKYWLLEQDLAQAINDFVEDDDGLA